MLKIFYKVLDFYKHKLSYQQESKNIEKLTRWALLFIVILDIFVYSAISMGIHFQTSTLNNPATKFTYQCRNIIEDMERVKDYSWYQYGASQSQNQNSTNHIYKDGTTLASKNVIRDIRLKELDARCAEINIKITNIANSLELKNIKASMKSLEQQRTKLHADLSYIQDNYNTVLFEKIANQSESDSLLKMDLEAKNVKTKYDNLQKEIAFVQKNLTESKAKFQTNPMVNELYSYIQENKAQIVADYQKANSRYFLKKAGIVVLFLLPIILLFYWQMGVQNIKRNYTKYIIFKNIFAISMVFFLINTLSIIYNFIPHVFVEKVLMFFYTLEIPFIAYYILLFLGIVVFSFVILRVQNFNKNKKKTTITFIESYKFGKCDKCGVKVDYLGMNFCPNCANTLKVICPKCGTHTIKNFEYCFHCNEKINQDEA